MKEEPVYHARMPGQPEAWGGGKQWKPIPFQEVRLWHPADLARQERNEKRWRIEAAIERLSREGRLYVVKR